MDIQVHEMMCACVETEKLTVDHMRNPRHRMPIGGVAFCKCPDDVSFREAACYVGIIIDIFIIVKINKIMFLDRPVRSKNSHGKAKRDDETRGSRGCRGCDASFFHYKQRPVRLCKGANPAFLFLK